MLCVLLFSKMNQLYVYIYPFFESIPDKQEARHLFNQFPGFRILFAFLLMPRLIRSNFYPNSTIPPDSRVISQPEIIMIYHRQYLLLVGAVYFFKNRILLKILAICSFSPQIYTFNQTTESSCRKLRSWEIKQISKKGEWKK